LGPRWSALEFAVGSAARGEIKQALIKIGFPAEDLAGYSEGEPLPMAFRERTRSGQPFSLRPYQQEAAAAFHAAGTARGGSGVITLPCGAGKTIVAMACMERLQTSTLVLTTSVTANRRVQWRFEAGARSDHRHLPDHDLEARQGIRLPTLETVREPQLGLDYL
jgi:DNA excision repair protein ERCC-3